MNKASKIIGLVTARGGSKGIPKKNIMPLASKPLIAWSIEAAKQSQGLERVIVSTDDEEISIVAKRWGADVPFTRPSYLAQDDSPHIEVVIHALEWLKENQDYVPDYVMLLQPTSPFRTSNDINAAIEIAKKSNADSVISVCKSPAHPYKIRNISSQGILSDFVEKPNGYLRRQDLPTAYLENGAIYLAKRNIVVNERTLHPEYTYAYIMKSENSLDIDTFWDFCLAEIILKNKAKMRHQTP